MLQARDIAYLHLSEADWDDAPVTPESFRIELRKLFSNAIMSQAATHHNAPKKC